MEHTIPYLAQKSTYLLLIIEVCLCLVLGSHALACISIPTTIASLSVWTGICASPTQKPSVSVPMFLGRISMVGDPGFSSRVVVSFVRIVVLLAHTFSKKSDSIPVVLSLCMTRLCLDYLAK